VVHKDGIAGGPKVCFDIGSIFDCAIYLLWLRYRLSGFQWLKRVDYVGPANESVSDLLMLEKTFGKS